MKDLNKPVSENTFKNKKFLVKQLIARDLKYRYNRKFLGFLWNVLSPLIVFLVQAVIFRNFFLNGEQNYISYILIGNIIFNYFTDATQNSMYALNSDEFTISKQIENKELFLISKNISCFINSLFSIVVMFIITSIDGLHFSVEYFWLLYPLAALFFFSLGIGYILSALCIRHKNMKYSYYIFTQVLFCCSAIFYSISPFQENYRKFFLLNPVYCFIEYFRTIMIYNTTPGYTLHILCFAYSVVFMMIGKLIYILNKEKIS